MHSAEAARIAVVAVLGGLAALAMGPAHAEETVCADTLGSIAVDNLRVPEGGTCTLNATRVNGTLKVGRDATLYARSVQVTGNVQAENAHQVSVMANSTIGGSIQIKQGGTATIRRARVAGDIQFESNSGALSALDNKVGGNLQVFQNRGGVRLAYNTIKGSLQCTQNVPAPTRAATTRPRVARKTSAGGFSRLPMIPGAPRTGGPPRQAGNSAGKPPKPV